MDVRRYFGRLRRATRGSIAVEAAFIAPILALLTVGVVNYGGAMVARTELFNAVHAGLQYALIYPADTDGMKGAAMVASSTEHGAGTMTVTSSLTCYCNDGTSSAGSCDSACTANTGVNYQAATITASQTYSYLLKFPGFPTSVTLSESASIRNNNQ